MQIRFLKKSAKHLHVDTAVKRFHHPATCTCVYTGGPEK